MPRRERWSILGAVLKALDDVRVQRGEDARLTHVATRANVPYDRLRERLRELQAAGLIAAASDHGEHIPHVTPEGYEFLRQYRQWLEVLERFGVA